MELSKLQEKEVLEELSRRIKIMFPDDNCKLPFKIEFTLGDLSCSFNYTEND